MSTRTIAAAASEISAAAQPTTSGTAGFALDISGGLVGPGPAIANNGTIAIGANFSGFVIVNDTGTTGSVATFVCGGGFVTLVGTTHAEYSTTLGTASKINVAYSGGVLTLENKTGVLRTVNVMAFRTRASN